MALVKAHRMHGHLAARLDPLGSEPLGDPALDETRLIPPLTPELQERIPAHLLRVHVPGETLKEALPNLRAVYSGTMAYEIEHLSDHAERVWLRQAIESSRYRQPLAPEERIRLLDSLGRAEGFEQYLRRSFLGQKQFSLEGLDAMMPMLDEAIELAADAGAHEVVIGMAHRGRLNVLVHTVGRSYESILREFEGERTIDAVVVNDEGGTGDVKYHLSATGTRKTPSGEVTITLAPNPSHLEAVDPVVEGWTRAEQTDRSSGAGIHDPSVALPILIHGDASFAGQGVVAETLNLSSLDGYTTGGTLHLIANNQVGFTTEPERGPLDALLERPRQGVRHPDHPRQRERSRGRDRGRAPRARLPAGVRPRHRRRPGRLPPLRPQRAGRGRVHAASDGRADRGAADRRPALLRPARRRGRAERGGGEGGLRGDAGEAARRARAAEGVDRRAARAEGRDGSRPTPAAPSSPPSRPTGSGR